MLKNNLLTVTAMGLMGAMSGSLFDRREAPVRQASLGKKKASKSDKARRKNSAKGAKAARR